MFKALWSFGLYGSDSARAVRRAVFVEERGIPEAEQFDWFDGVAAHLFVSDENDTPIAAGRLYPDGTLVRMDSIAVMPAFRNLPYYDLVLRTMLYKAQEIAKDHITATVPTEEAACFLPFGFTKDAELTFHGTACTELSVPADGVIWDSPCKHGKPE